MSLAHIRLIRISDDNISAQYTVESFDFTVSRQWADLGTLNLDKHKRSYDFIPSALWIEKKGIPPSVYALEQAKQSEILTAKYQGCGWGTWAMIIHHYAMNFLQKSSYLKTYPPLFFTAENSRKGQSKGSG
jgi:hypothetical protein